MVSINRVFRSFDHRFTNEVWGLKIHICHPHRQHICIPKYHITQIVFHTICVGTIYSLIKIIYHKIFFNFFCKFAKTIYFCKLLKVKKIIT